MRYFFRLKHFNNWTKLAREKALIEQGGRCLYCLTKLTRTTVTADHRVPKQHGGLDNDDNIDALCSICNRLKGAKNAGRFKRSLKISQPGNLELQTQGAIRRINLQADRACKRILASVRVVA